MKKIFLLVLNTICSYGSSISKNKYKFINNSAKARKHVKEMLYSLQQMIKQIRALQLVKEVLKASMIEVNDIEWYEKK